MFMLKLSKFKVLRAVGFDAKYPSKVEYTKPETFIDLTKGVVI